MKINLGKVFDTGGGGREPIVEALSVTANGTYTPNEGVDGFNPVSVDVQPPLQTKAVEITANGQSTIEADSEYYGLESVGLNVNVQPNLQAKSTSTTITENGTSTITLEPDNNYDGLSSASVTITTNVASSGGGKYVVPNGIKFGYSSAFNPDDFDFSNVTNMSGMFYFCSNLTSLDIGNWDVSQVTDTDNMFYYCSNLTSLDIGNWDVSQVKNMSSMFNYCSKLTSLDIGNWDMGKVTSVFWMFNHCTSLTDLNMNGVILPKMNLTNLGLNSCTALTVESLVSVLNALPQLSSSESFTCTIGETNLAKLNDTEKSIATNKNWIIN